jgi:O-antigen ligase
MNMSSKHILYFYLVLSAGFYLGFIRFFGSLIGVGGAHGDFEAAAAGNPINQASALLLLLMSIMLILKSPRINIRDFLSQGWIWLLLIVFFAASILWSATPFITLRRVVAFSTLVLVGFVLVNAFTPRSLLSFIANAIVAAVVIGVFYHLLSGQNIAFGLTDRSAGLRGIFSDKNAAARVYAYGLILFIGLGKYKKKSEIIRLSILLLAVLLSQSASAVILAFLGCSLIFTFKFFRGKNKKQNATRIIIIMIVLVSGALIAGALYEYLLELLGRDSNLTNRAIIWELLTPFLESKPVLGYGFGSFWASDDVSPFLERWGFIGNSHSGYFEAMLNGGLVGFCLLIALMSLFAKYALSNYASRQSYKDYSELVLAILISQAVLNYIGFIILNHNSVDMYVFLLAFFTSAIQFKGRNYS